MAVRTTIPTYRFHNARLIISTNPLLKFSLPFLPEAPSQLYQLTPRSSSICTFLALIIDRYAAREMRKVWRRFSDTKTTFHRCKYSKVRMRPAADFHSMSISWDCETIESDWPLIFLQLQVSFEKSLSVYKTVSLQNYLFRDITLKLNKRKISEFCISLILVK